MKKSLLCALMLLVSFSTYTVQQAAKKSEAAPVAIVTSVEYPTTMGFINSYEVMLQSNEGKKIQGTIKSKEKAFQTELANAENLYKKMVDEYKVKVDSKVVDQKVLREEERKIKEKENELRMLVQEMQDELNNLAQELTATLSQIVESEIKVFAETNKFTVIFDIATGRIVYCAPELNKTPMLTELVNNKTAKTTASAKAAQPADKNKKPNAST